MLLTSFDVHITYKRRCTPKHNIISLVADMVTSFSFHEQLTGFGAMKHAALPPVQPRKYNSSKTYVRSVCILMDGSAIINCLCLWSVSVVKVEIDGVIVPQVAIIRSDGDNLQIVRLCDSSCFCLQSDPYQQKS